jgi:hypothetical protein
MVGQALLARLLEAAAELGADRTQDDTPGVRIRVRA